MQSFLGKIKFLRKFISDYAEIFKPIQNIIKKDVIHSWGKKEKYAFTRIKKAIAETLALYSPDFKKDFLLYTFASNNWLVVILTQMDEMKDECLISFMSTSIQGPKYNYFVIYMQAYAIYKAMKQFRPYLLKDHSIVFVPHPTICTLLVQQGLGEGCANWMTGLREYYLQINLVHMIKGHVLCILAVEVVHI